MIGEHGRSLHPETVPGAMGIFTAAEKGGEERPKGGDVAAR